MVCTGSALVQGMRLVRRSWAKLVILVALATLIGCSNDSRGPYVLSSSQSTFVVPEYARIEKPKQYSSELMIGDDASRSLLVEISGGDSRNTSTQQARLALQHSVVGVFTAAEALEVQRQLTAWTQEVRRINEGLEEFASSRVEPEASSSMWRIYRNDSAGKQWVQLHKQPPLGSYSELLGHCIKTELGLTPRCLVTVVGRDYLFTTHLTVAELAGLDQLESMVGASADRWRAR